MITRLLVLSALFALAYFGASHLIFPLNILLMLPFAGGVCLVAAHFKFSARRIEAGAPQRIESDEHPEYVEEAMSTYYQNRDADRPMPTRRLRGR